MFTIYGGKTEFNQWDLEQLVTCSCLKEGDKVVFSGFGKAYETTAFVQDGQVWADVPNFLLKEPGYIRVDLGWGLECHMDCRTTFTVVATAKPDGYVCSYNIKPRGNGPSWNDLTDKPTINGVELNGDMSSDDLGISANPVSGGEWTLLGDVTVDTSIEFIPTSIENGVVTIDPASENYDALSSTGYNYAVIVGYSVVTGRGWDSRLSCVYCKLLATDYDAGTFALYDGDNGIISTAYDVASYKIVLQSVKTVYMSGISQWDRYKVRYTLPYSTNHGARQRFSSNVGAFGWPALSAVNKTGSTILELETEPYMDGTVYHHILRKEFYHSQFCNKNNFFGADTLPASSLVIPSDGIVSFSALNDIFGLGARIQLWGANK